VNGDSTVDDDHHFFLKLPPLFETAKFDPFIESKIDNYLFQISDNGIGIDPDYFDKIFLVFQRLHQRKVYLGTGTGLAIVKKTTEMLGG